MNDAMRREIGEEAVAVKLANYVLDREMDPDADICILARQFLRKREVMRSIVTAVGGSVFVPSKAIRDSAHDTRTMVVSRNDEKHGYDVLLRDDAHAQD